MLVYQKGCQVLVEVFNMVGFPGVKLAMFGDNTLSGLSA